MRGRSCDGGRGVRQPEHAQAEQLARGSSGCSREAPDGHAGAEGLRAGVAHHRHGEPGVQVHLARRGPRAQGICALPLKRSPQGLKHSDEFCQLLEGGLRENAECLRLSE